MKKVPVKSPIYADHAATTPLAPEALEAMRPYLTAQFGNASQPYTLGRSARHALEAARAQIASCIGAQTEEIYFTSGGTESNNWAIKGSAFADPDRRATLTSRIEHASLLRACAFIGRMGYPAFYLPVDTAGRLSAETLREALQDEVRLVSIMMANNEIGTIQDIASLAELAHERGALFHTDAVQAIAHLPLDVRSLAVDLLSASAHKFNGPKGLGFLYVRKGTPLLPLISGGGQEQGMRAGTESVALAVGMATALAKNISNLEANTQHLERLEARLLQGLRAASIPFVRNGEGYSLPSIISLSFPNAEGEALLHRLDLLGIAISTGSACNGHETHISHVLQAIHLAPSHALGTIRISLGPSNTPEDIDAILEGLKRGVGGL